MSDQSNTLLNEAIDAHGGLDRWRAFKGVASTIVSGGRLREIKGAKIIPTPRLRLSRVNLWLLKMTA